MDVAVVGYGNVGKSLCEVIAQDGAFNLVGVYSRRNLHHPLYKPLNDVGKCHCDVALLALGSQNDVMQNARLFAHLDTVDCFDLHGQIDDYKRLLKQIKPDKTSIVATGWDPGVLSAIRAVLGMGANTTATVWGKGVSQGHSNALRSICGVIDAVQFTCPIKDWQSLAEKGVTDGKKLHERICYVACVEADKQRIEKEIKGMPHYFEGYDTTVEFCSPQEVRKYKQNTGHNGQIVANGKGFEGYASLKIENNARFTAKIMLQYAKALPKLKRDGYVGALDVLDIPLKYLCDKSVL